MTTLASLQSTFRAQQTPFDSLIPFSLQLVRWRSHEDLLGKQLYTRILIVNLTKVIVIRVLDTNLNLGFKKL